MTKSIKSTTPPFEVTVERAAEIARILAEKAKNPPRKATLTRSEAMAQWRAPIQSMLAAGYTIGMIAEELKGLAAPISAVTLGKAIRDKAAEKTRKKKSAATSDERKQRKLETSNKPDMKEPKSSSEESDKIGVATPEMTLDEF